MAIASERAANRAGTENFVSECFGYRVFATARTDPASLREQQTFPFLSAAEGSASVCIKSERSRGVCTVSTMASGIRRDWLDCPYCALDPRLLNSAIARLFGGLDLSTIFVVPAIPLVTAEIQAGVLDKLRSEHRVFIYFDEKLGGELSIPETGSGFRKRDKCRAAVSAARGFGSRAGQAVMMGLHRSQQITASNSGGVVGIGPDPAGAQQRRGVRLGHVDRAVRSHAAAEAGKQLDLRDATRGAQADARARRLPSTMLLGALPVYSYIPALELGPAPRLNQSSICAVESTWSS